MTKDRKRDSSGRGDASHDAPRKRAPKSGGAKPRDSKVGDSRRRDDGYRDTRSPPPVESDEAPLRAPRGLSPAKSHGTRVKYNIVCARCGKEDTLPFVPRTMGEILCHVCAEDVFGENWAHGRKLDYPEEYAFKCARCGREDHVRFRPRPDKQLLCRHCLRGDEQPETERLKRMKKVT